SYRAFMLRIFKAARRVLRRRGVAVFVIGDVATPGRESLALARQVWDDIGGSTGLRLIDLIEDELPHLNKVSRIWGETRGQATNRDCVLVLAREDAEPEHWPVQVAWDEPYK